MVSTSFMVDTSSHPRAQLHRCVEKSAYEWNEVFPNAACVVSLVDRLIHHAEILALQGKSYRLKEAQERAEQRARQRRRAKS